MSPRLVACRSILVGACLAVTAAASAQVPADAPVVQAAKMSSTPVLDGRVLGDSAWIGLSPTSGFWQVQPDDGEPATQKTEVYVGFSDDALYIGVIAYDDDPDAILGDL